MTPEEERAALRAEIDRSFRYHPPRDEEDVAKHERVTELFVDLAFEMAEMLPGGREAAIVRTKLQEARMFANAALALDRAPKP